INRYGVSSYSALCYSPDGRSLAIVGNGKVSLLEVGTGKMRAHFTLPAHEINPNMPYFPGSSVAIAPDGRTLAVRCPDGSVRRGHLKTGRELPPLGTHSGAVLAVSFSPDGKTLRSVGADMKLYAWSTGGNREWRPKTGSLTEANLTTLWEMLRSDDAL